MSAILRTEQIDFLYSSTWANRTAEIQDNVFNSQVFFAWLSANERIKNKPGGGLHIEERLLYGKNTTFASVGKGGKVNVNPLDGRTMTKWEWKNTIGAITRYRDDSFKNRGKYRQADMVAEDIEIAEISLKDELTRQLFLDGTGNNGIDYEGIQRLIADDPTASGSYATVGGIPLSGRSWWENQYKDMSGLSFSTVGPEWMANTMNNCEDGNALVDLILTSQILWEKYEKEVTGLQMVVPTEKKRNKIADLGFRTLYFKEVPIVYDKNMPTVLNTKMYFLNSKTFYLVKSDIQWFEMTKWQDVPQQPGDRVAYIMCTGNLLVNNRRRNGVMFNFA